MNDTFRVFVRRRFVRWYMGRIAGRYCPCEWPIKSKRLMHLCGRIDDLNEIENFRDSCRWVLEDLHQTTGSSATTAANFTFRRGSRRPG